MIKTQAISPPNTLLAEEKIQQTLHIGLGEKFTHQKVLVLIPDHTRSLPLHQLFRTLVELLQDTQRLDFMVALGTHHPLKDDQLNGLVGITSGERSTTYKHIGLLNHNWKDADTLTQIATLPQAQIRGIAGEFWHSNVRR